MIRAFWLGCISWFALLGLGQEASQEASTLDTRLIGERIVQLELELAEETRSENSAYLAWRAAQAALEEFKLAQANQANLERVASEAPALLEALRTELARSPILHDESEYAEFTREALEAEFTGATAQVSAARSSRDEQEQAAVAMANRRRELPEILVRLRSREGSLLETLGQAQASAEGDDLQIALYQQAAAELAATRAEISAIQVELTTHELRSELNTVRRERAAQILEATESRLAVLRSALETRRSSEASEAALEAQARVRETMGEHELLRQLAAENEAYAERRVHPEGATKKLALVTEQLSDLEQRLRDLRSRIRTTSRRVEVAGLSTAIGLYLRGQYEELPRMARLATQSKLCQAEASEAQYQVLILEEDAQRSEEMERELKALSSAEEAAGRQEEAGELASVGGELLTARRELLRALIADYNKLFDTYVELDFVTQETERLTLAFRRFIEERILGVRSIAGHLSPSLSELKRELGWLFDPKAWLETFEAVMRGAWNRFGPTFWRFLLLALVLGMQPLARRMLRESGEQVANYATDRFAHTLRGLFATVVLSLPLGLCLYLAYRLLESAVMAPEVATAAAAGLESCAAWFLTIELIRQVFRSDGLARRHFRWPEASVTFVRRQLRWLDALALPAIFLVVTMDREPHDLRGDSLARIALWIGLVALASFARRVLRPSGSALALYLSKSRGGWMDRLRFVWYPLAIGLPIAAVALSAAGYHYTAIQITLRYLATMGFVFALVLANSLLLRWLFVAKRQLLLEAAAQRREAREAADKREEGEALELGPAEEGSFNFPAINEKTRKLFASMMIVAAFAGFWRIWEDVLPAIRLLDRVQVWPSLEIQPMAKTAVDELGLLGNVAEKAAPIPVENEAPVAPTLTNLPQPSSAVAPAGLTHRITLSDVLYALVALLMTVIAARDLPALIEIVLLQFFDLDAGARYAIGSIARYFVSLVGGSLVLSALNIGWSNVQWLAAALTFGLAFGLQEIFANFVSGLILLVERPVRVGDLVTVGGVEGWVSRIRFRATTILDADRRELIVPNKEFITGSLINWTLTDPITRVKLPVGIAINADTKLARELLLQAADEAELALKEPKPRAIFIKFGESTLDFELRVFIENRELAPDMIHDLHTRILEKFTAHAIEMPFPQRDLHLRSGFVEQLGGQVPRFGK